MADPFRLRVLKAMTDTLKAISTESGYENDLGDTVEGDDLHTVERVFRGRDTFGDGDALPMLSVLEHPAALDVIQSRGATASNGDWQLLVQGFARNGDSNPTDAAYLLAADAIKALAAEKRRDRSYNIFGLGGDCPCVTDIEIGSPVCRPADGINSDTAFFWMTVTLTLSEDLENPYA